MPTRKELESQNTNVSTVLTEDKTLTHNTHNVSREIQLTQYKDGIGIQVRGDPDWAKDLFDQLRAEYKDVPGFGSTREERRKERFNR